MVFVMDEETVIKPQLSSSKTPVFSADYGTSAKKAEWMGSVQQEFLFI